MFEGNYEGGTPHGYFRHINGYGDLEFFGCFHRGTLLGKEKRIMSVINNSSNLVLGVCWKSLPGGGFLVSKSWNFSDPHSLYLYPDCRTALLGSFNGERLEVAREAEVSTHCKTISIFTSFNALPATANVPLQLFISDWIKV